MRLLVLGLMITSGLALAADPCGGAPSSAGIVELPGSPFKLVVSHDGCTIYASMAGKHPGLAILKRSATGLSLFKSIQTKQPLLGLVLTHDGKSLIGTSGKSVLFMNISGEVLGEVDEDARDRKVYVNVTTDDKTLFVSNEGSHSISVLDVARRAVVKRIQVGNSPIALTFSPDGKLLYTTSQAALTDWGWPAVCEAEGTGGASSAKHPRGAVVVIDVTSREVVSRIEAGCNPVRLALSADGAKAYVTTRKDNKVLVFDTAKWTRVAEIPVGTAPVPVAVVGDKVLVGNSNRFGTGPGEGKPVSVIDAANNRVTGTLAAGQFPRDIVVSPDGKTIYIANFGSGTVSLLGVPQ